VPWPRRHGWSGSRPTNEYDTGHVYLAARSVHADSCPAGGHGQARWARDSGKDIREEAKDALSHYSEFVAGRQAQVISSLTIVATVFLPLSFLTGYFGMNFRILTADLQNTLWQFILLGLLLLIASVTLSLLLIHRLERRFGIRRIGQRPG